jgi:hypothetical protein
MDGVFGGGVNVDVVDARDDSRTGNRFDGGRCCLSELIIAE